MILLLFFFWADLSQWGQKQKKEINSQGLIKMFITQKLVNLTPSGQIQVTHKLIIPLIIPSPFFKFFTFFRDFQLNPLWGREFGVGVKMEILIQCMFVLELVADRVERRHDRSLPPKPWRWGKIYWQFLLKTAHFTGFWLISRSYSWSRLSPCPRSHNHWIIFKTQILLIWLKVNYGFVPRQVNISLYDLSKMSPKCQEELF